VKRLTTVVVDLGHPPESDSSSVSKEADLYFNSSAKSDSTMRYEDKIHREPVAVR